MKRDAVPKPAPPPHTLAPAMWKPPGSAQQGLEDRISTSHNQWPCHVLWGCDVGSGESPRGGTGGRAETTHAQHRSPHTPVVISCEQPPGLQRPFIDSAEPNPISPIVSSLAPSTPLWPRAEGQARGLRVVPLPTRDAARPRCTPHSTARLPALGWHPSPRAARSYILFSLSSSFGN